MGWQLIERGNRYSKQDFYRKFNDSRDTAPLATMTFIQYGPDPSYHTFSSFYHWENPYVVAAFTLIRLVREKECAELDIVDIKNPEEAGFTAYSNMSIFESVTSLENMIISGTIKSGRTRIGVNPVKRADCYFHYPKFPPEMKSILSASEYITYSAFLNFGSPGQIRIPKVPVPAEEFLKGMVIIYVSRSIPICWTSFGTG